MTDTESTTSGLKYLFTAYLHQDWDIEGATLREVFQNHTDLQSSAVSIKSDIEALLRSGPTEGELDDLLIGVWATGYEPDDRIGETWTGVLKDISVICDRYIGTE